MNNDHLTNKKTHNLVKAYEKLHKIPKKDCVTDINDEMFAMRYADALVAINWSNDEFQSSNSFENEQKVFDFMRKCLLCETLNEGDLVVCVPYLPFKDNGSTYYTYEKIKWIDSDGLCGVELMGVERWIPISHVLARFNAEAHPFGAFYMPNAELMFLDNEEDAKPMLLQAKEQHDSIVHSLSVMRKAFAEHGLSPDTGLPLNKQQRGGTRKTNKKPKLAERLDDGKRKVSEQDSKKPSSKSKKKEERE